MNYYSNRESAECGKVQEAVPAIVAATVRVYNEIRAELLPTPSRSHYTFNLRDVARVVQARSSHCRLS